LKAEWSFDQGLYQELNTTREQVLREVLAEQKANLELKTAIDVGCGVGHFSNFLHSQGLEVLGVDAREENIEEARRRYPDIEFRVVNAEDPDMRKLGTFDFVLCLGLLYHLENPFLVLRQLGALTAKLAMVEGVCYPSNEPAMVLMDESKAGDQGVNYVAFYPSEACLLKMLYRSSFTDCFYPWPMPGHPFYQKNLNGFRYRTMMGASKVAVRSERLVREAEPQTDLTPYNMMPLRAWGLRTDRLAGLFQKALHLFTKK